MNKNINNEKKLWEEFGAIQKDEPFPFGPYYSYQWRNTPRHILFTLSRYKFALKIIGQNKDILELGSNEGLGSYFLSEFASSVKGIDFDEGAINWAQQNYTNKKLTFEYGNFLEQSYGEHDAVVSMDVIEHIYPENEDAYIKAIANNLKHNGIALIGTPNIETDKFANPEIKGAHINLYSAERLTESFEKYFNNVFLFSQNDEIIHTGYTPTSNYFIALCTYKKTNP